MRLKRCVGRCIFVAILWSLNGCSNLRGGSTDACQFKYTEDAKSLISSVLAEKLDKEIVKYFNVENPVITKKDHSSRVVLSPINLVGGKMVMLEKSYVFVFDNCEGRLIEFFGVVRN